jgi:hypothetical protein
MPTPQDVRRTASFHFGPLIRLGHGLASYVSRALTSAAFPIRGIWYFLRHPEFYPLFVGRLLPLSIISFLVYFLLFTFAFLPQFLFLLIIQGLFEGFFVDECRVDIFDVS